MPALLPSGAVPAASFLPPTTSSSSVSATTVWLTASSVATVTVDATPSSGGAQADTTPSSTSRGGRPLFIGQQDGNNWHHDGKHHDRPPPNNNKFAIAFGTIGEFCHGIFTSFLPQAPGAWSPLTFGFLFFFSSPGAVGFLVGIIWAAILLRRRHRHNKRRDDQSSISDASAASLGKSGQQRGFNLKWPFLRRLPFIKGSVPTRLPAAQQHAFAMRFGGGGGATGKRSNSSIMDEAMGAAYYGSQSEESASINPSSVQGYFHYDEKKHDPRFPLPLLAPAPVHQASIRKSIASWFRRASGHHPLKLNPMSRWSQSTTATGGRRRESQYSISQYAVSVHELPADNNVPPPMPDLSIMHKAAYTAAHMHETGSNTSSSSSSELSAVPSSVFTRNSDDNDAQAPKHCTSHWADTSSSSVAGVVVVEGQEEERRAHVGGAGSLEAGAGRMSASSWTSGARTTMQGSDRASSQGMQTGEIGLSPPSYYSGSNRTREAGMATLDGGAAQGQGSQAPRYSSTNM